MASTNRKYTHINFEQVVTDLQSILSAKEGALADLGESSYGKTLIELFAANSDLIANWGESIFADTFLETATSPEAIYLGARSLGYSVRRPVPAKAGFGISLKRTGVYPTVKVNIPRGIQFSVSSVTMTAIDDCEFTYTRNDPNFEDGLMRLTSGRAVLAEGTFDTAEFFSDGTQNQEFIVGDATFSDYFGFGDPNWSEADSFRKRQLYFTTVTSDASLLDNFDPMNAVDDKVYWRISRRGFQDPTIDNTVNDIDNFIESSNKTTNYSVIIDTANDGRARLSFGDGVNSAIPFGRISVGYFSTRGEDGNLLNVAGSNLNTDSNGILITQADGSESDLLISDLNIALVTDIRGGLNIEDSDSIKKNAPQIYNSLDSLGNRASYKTFLSRYSDIKYANAFGEDILTRVKSKGYGKEGPDIKYANIVRFTALKDLYRDKDGTYYPTDPFEYFVEGYKVNGLVYIWQYDYHTLPNSSEVDAIDENIQVLQSELQSQLDSGDLQISVKNPETGEQNVVTDASTIVNLYLSNFKTTALVPDSVFSAKLEPIDFTDYGSELEMILKALNRKGYITLGGGQHMYNHPIVHDFTIQADVILFRGMNFSDIKTKIRNAIYSYLKEYTEFASPIFRSKLECIIQRFPEVAGVNLKLVARGNDYEDLDLTRLAWMRSNTSQFINQAGIDFDGFDINLTYDYRYKQTSGADASINDNELTFSIGSQSDLSTKIDQYYKSYIAYLNPLTGNYSPRVDLKEEDINKFTSYIWATMINGVYVPMFEKYKEERQRGDALTANSIYHVIEAMRGWYMDEGFLSFKPTEYILNLTEENGKELYNYFVYTLEYIKLVRNILAPSVARRLVDSNGNITQYSNENEIVQFNISAEDITVNVESESYTSKERSR